MIWFVVCLFVCGSSGLPQARLIHTAQGPVQGYKDQETGLFIFYNIPYATAPSGPDKFKAPLPPPVWTKPFEAVDEGVICPQSDAMGFHPELKKIQEQCLIANVYVPDTNETNLPVVVYVHGGAFIIGWGDIATPKSLVLQSNKIIAVTFNYRLGAHGFLCLGTKDIPGNAGMKDQVALLRWVKKNIAGFGGNPEEVTVAGFSAGSSSVDLLMLSKMARGLFKRVIPESGANTAVFAVQVNPIKNAKEYAKLLNFNKVDDILALQEFFKSLSYDELNSGNVMNRTDSTFLTSPCLERFLGEETFLEESPVNILKSGNFEKLPMLYGFTNMEGLFRVTYFDSWKNLMNIKFSDFLPADLKFKNAAEKEHVAEKVRHFYFGDKLVDDNTILGYVKYFTDVLFAYATLRSAKLLVEAGNEQVYLYEYSYFDDNTPVVPHTNVRGANHCAQTFTILNGFGEPNENHAKVMRELWTNFITTGQPTKEGDKPRWPPVNAEWSPYMSLNKTLILRNSLLKKRATFWEKIYQKHYRFPTKPRRLIIH